MPVIIMVILKITSMSVILICFFFFKLKIRINLELYYGKQLKHLIYFLEGLMDKYYD